MVDRHGYEAVFAASIKTLGYPPVLIVTNVESRAVATELGDQCDE